MADENEKQQAPQAPASDPAQSSAAPAAPAAPASTTSTPAATGAPAAHSGLHSHSHARPALRDLAVVAGAAVGGPGGAAPSSGPGGRPGGPAKRGQAQFRPQEEGLPLLRGQGRLHRLQEGRNSRALHSGARQDSSAAHDGHVRAAPALADRGDQARAEYRAAAVCRRAVNAP